jgi:CRISPR-associated protein Cas2
MNYSRLNAYQIMWIFVFFDLPVTTKTERRKATRFRKDLLQDGFSMMQYSVYTRHCASRESAKVHIKRIKRLVPSKGQVSILSVTDKQYGKIINIWGKKSLPVEKPPPQLEMF